MKRWKLKLRKKPKENSLTTPFYSGDKTVKNEETISLQRWEKSKDWFNFYKAKFKEEYQSDNPFWKIDKKCRASNKRRETTSDK